MGAKRGKDGRFYATCRGGVVTRGPNDGRLVACDKRARFAIDGWGYFGLMGTTRRPVYCGTHARAALRRITPGAWAKRSTYKIVEILDANGKEVA